MPIEHPEKLEEVRYMASVMDSRGRHAGHGGKLSPWIVETLHSQGDGNPPISPPYIMDAAASLASVRAPLDKDGSLGVPDWDQIEQEYVSKWLGNHWEEACSWIDEHERVLSVQEKRNCYSHDELFRRAHVYMMRQARWKLWDFLADKSDEWLYTVLLETRRDGGPIKSTYLVQKNEPSLEDLQSKFSSCSKGDVRPVALLQGYCKNLIGDGEID